MVVVPKSQSYKACLSQRWAALFDQLSAVPVEHHHFRIYLRNILRAGKTKKNLCASYTGTSHYYPSFLTSVVLLWSLADMYLARICDLHREEGLTTCQDSIYLPERLSDRVTVPGYTNVTQLRIARVLGYRHNGSVCWARIQHNEYWEQLLRTSWGKQRRHY